MSDVIGSDVPTVASSINEVVSCWRLVYDQYLNSNLIKPNNNSIYTVPRAVSKNSLVLFTKNGELTSTITAILDSGNMILEDVYPEEIAILRNEGRRLIEIGLLASSGSIKSLIVLMRYVFYFSYDLRIDDLLIGINPKHLSFYTRLFTIQQIGPEKMYPRVNNNPVILCRGNFRDEIYNKLYEDMQPALQMMLLEKPENIPFHQRYGFAEDEIQMSPIGRFLRDNQ